MAEWIDIPAHRILLVPHQELANEYDRLGADGGPVAEGEQTALVRRRRDGCIFKPARFCPIDASPRALFVLEEL